jgi:hypothetical protein
MKSGTPRALLLENGRGLYWLQQLLTAQQVSIGIRLIIMHMHVRLHTSFRTGQPY